MLSSTTSRSVRPFPALSPPLPKLPIPSNPALLRPSLPRDCRLPSSLSCSDLRLPDASDVLSPYPPCAICWKVWLEWWEGCFIAYVSRWGRYPVIYKDVLLYLGAGNGAIPSRTAEMPEAEHDTWIPTLPLRRSLETPTSPLEANKLPRLPWRVIDSHICKVWQWINSNALNLREVSVKPLKLHGKKEERALSRSGLNS